MVIEYRSICRRVRLLMNGGNRLWKVLDSLMFKVLFLIIWDVLDEFLFKLGFVIFFMK